MQKIKKIEIKVNGKVQSIAAKSKMSDLVKNLKIPIKKVAIELNQEIIAVSYTHLTLPTKRIV